MKVITITHKKKSEIAISQNSFFMSDEQYKQMSKNELESQCMLIARRNLGGLYLQHTVRDATEEELNQTKESEEKEND